MTNEYGLDVSYFRKKLGLIRRDLDRYTPAELRRELLRMADVSEPIKKMCINRPKEQRDCLNCDIWVCDNWPEDF